MPSALKGERYRLELWVDAAGEIEDEAFAYPCLTRASAGALKEQNQLTVVMFKPSAALKAALKAEQKAKVDAEVAK